MKREKEQKEMSRRDFVKGMAAGIPVVKGTAKYGSRSDLYIGNGDTVVF